MVGHPLSQNQMCFVKKCQAKSFSLRGKVARSHRRREEKLSYFGLRSDSSCFVGPPLPRPSHRCFLEAFEDIKTTRKHLLEGVGRTSSIFHYIALEQHLDKQPGSLLKLASCDPSPKKKPWLQGNQKGNHGLMFRMNIWKMLKPKAPETMKNNRFSLFSPPKPGFLGKQKPPNLGFEVSKNRFWIVKQAAPAFGIQATMSPMRRAKSVRGPWSDGDRLSRWDRFWGLTEVSTSCEAELSVWSAWFSFLISRSLCQRLSRGAPRTCASAVWRPWFCGPKRSLSHGLTFPKSLIVRIMYFDST